MQFKQPTSSSFHFVFKGVFGKNIYKLFCTILAAIKKLQNSSNCVNKNKTPELDAAKNKHPV